MRRPRRDHHPHQDTLTSYSPTPARVPRPPHGADEPDHALHRHPRSGHRPTDRAQRHRPGSRHAYRNLSRTLAGIGAHPDKKKLLHDTRLSLCHVMDTLAEVDSREDFYPPRCVVPRTNQCLRHPSPRRPGSHLHLRACTEVAQHDRHTPQASSITPRSNVSIRISTSPSTPSSTPKLINSASLALHDAVPGPASTASTT